MGHLGFLDGLACGQRQSFVAHGLLAAQTIAVLPITGPDAERARSHPAARGDPFDRMIAAQATLRGLTVVSNNAQLHALGAARLW